MRSRRATIAAFGTAIAGTAGCLDADGDEAATESDADRDETATGSDDGRADASANPTDGEGSIESPVSARNPEATFLTASGSDGDADERVLATYGDVVGIGAIEPHRQSGYALPVRFGEDAVEPIVAELEAIGALDGSETVELAVRVDGETLDSYRLGPSLAALMADGEWDGTLTIGSSDESALETLRDEFRSA